MIKQLLTFGTLATCALLMTSSDPLEPPTSKYSASWPVQIKLPAESNLSIVPAPQQWQPASGVVDVIGAPMVIEPAQVTKLYTTAQIIQEDLLNMGFPKPDIIIGEKPKNRPYIKFTLTDTPFSVVKDGVQEQAYTIEIKPEGVTISAHNCGGVYAATRSLLQMLMPGGRQIAILPCGKMTDAPVTKMRMLMLDVGRKVFPIETLYDYLRVLGWYKMNVLHLHLSDNSFDHRYGGFRVQSDTFPGLTSKDYFYTKKQLREFQDRAAAMGIMILPEIDMPAHAAAFAMYWPDLAWEKDPYAGSLDVNNPQLIPQMKKVLDEMIPIFDAPFFHIGTDEYGVKCRNEQHKLETGENFRKFINTMNAYIRSRGKECVIWDGWEHVSGTTEIDPTVVVDMWWGIFDTKEYIRRGHKVINSCQDWSYLTSGRPTYGVDNAYVYNSIKPNSFGKVNVPMNDPNFLGTKLHVWVGQGPTGWTMTEIAGETFESIRALSETLWGRKGSADYSAFLVRARPLEKVPGVTVLNRVTSHNNIILDIPEEIIMKRGDQAIPLLRENPDRSDLEFPWTLTMEIRKDKENGRGVILSSKMAEIVVNYSWIEKTKVVNEAEAVSSKENIKTNILKGFGLIRATGNWKCENPTPFDTRMQAENSRVYSDSLPCGKWMKITVVAEKRYTRFYLDGQLIKEQTTQAICPLSRIGSIDPNHSFVGAIRNLRVCDQAMPPVTDYQDQDIRYQ